MKKGAHLGTKFLVFPLIATKLQLVTKGKSQSPITNHQLPAPFGAS